MDQLINQSAQGVHILFDRADIVQAIKAEDLEKDEEDSLEKLQKIQELLYTFIQFKDLDEKRAYLKTLSKGEYLVLIRAYFKIVDNSIMNKQDNKH